MFLLERRKQNDPGSNVHASDWETIYICPERKPLEFILTKLDRRNYRITAREPGGA